MAAIETRLFINGKVFVEASDGRTFPLYSPATKEKVADVSEASEEDTNAAVAAAKAAFPAWSALSPSERGVPLRKLAQLIEENHDELARLDALSMGRPVSTFADPGRASAHFNHYAEAGYEALGTSSVNTPGFVNLTLRQPFGVVAAIIPWNGPLVFLPMKAAPALVAGNTIVLKSSEKAPLTVGRMKPVPKSLPSLKRLVFPPGVFNIISGHGHISGNVLSHHMDVRALSFTGSGRTGRIIQQAAAKSNMKNVILELGGKSPSIIFPDAELDKAAKETMYSIQWNSGQKSLSTVVKGDPLDPKTTHGPQADKLQWESVQHYIEASKKLGQMVLGSEEQPDDSNGYFIEPTIFLGVPEDAKAMKEEIFGPVVHINTFSTEDEVVAKANDSEYGLYASVYTNDLSRALRMAKKLESGNVAINCTSPTGALDMPFGGYKSSGVGREGYTVSIDQYLETKTVLMKIDEETSL
ncbi:Retinal dehydrogenase 1 [Penicillium chermesinum]|nr:Retinal dehydrogenase 1 [Penicillium chermesinum]